MMWYLGPRPEPVGIDWTPAGITVEDADDPEWWYTRLGRLVKREGT